MTDIVTQYTLTVPDKTKLDGVVPLVVKLGAYRTYAQQESVAVSNQLLSDVSTVETTGSSLTSTYVAAPSVTYISAINSALQANGFQMAHVMANFNLINLSSHGTGYATVTLEYSYNGSTWTFADQAVVAIQPTFHYNNNATWTNYANAYVITNIALCRHNYLYDDAGYYYDIAAGYAGVNVPTNLSISDNVSTWGTHISLSAIVGGITSASRLYTRVRVDVPVLDGVGVYLAYSTSAIQIVPRHAHNWVQTGLSYNTMKAVQTDNVKDLTAATPTTISYRINSGAWTSLSCPAGNSYTGTVADITSLLVNGTNTIEFKSAVACTVRPTIAYKVFGT